MVDVTRVEKWKWDPKVGAWEPEVLPYDVKPLYDQRVTAAGGADESFPVYSAPSGNVSIVTAVKMISESADAWWSFGGDISDHHFMPAKGADAIEGAAEDPYTVLNEGESIVPVAKAAAGDTDYAVMIYGAEREKKPRGA